MIEILPVVFAVVSEYLRRERAKAERRSDEIEEDQKHIWEGVSDWILHNYKDVIDAFRAVDFLNPLESTKYLLSSVYEAMMIFQENGVRATIFDSKMSRHTLKYSYTHAHTQKSLLFFSQLSSLKGIEVPLLLRIGETCSLMGESHAACKSYKRILRHFKSNNSTHTHDWLLHAEAHLLLSKVMFAMGELEYVFNEEEEVYQDQGAKWHVEQAQKILDSVEKAEGTDKNNLMLLKRSARIQRSKLLIHLEDHQAALEHFTGSDEENACVDAVDGQCLDSTDSDAGFLSHRAPTHTIPSQVTADELDFKQLYALALFKAGQKMQAKEEFEAILKQIEEDQSGTEVSHFKIQL